MRAGDSWFDKWRANYGRMNVSPLVRVVRDGQPYKGDLGRNRRLNRMYAELILQNNVLIETLECIRHRFKDNPTGLT